MKKKPMRILQVGLTTTIGGMEMYVMEQFRHLDKSKIVYDFVNNTSESGKLAFTDEILKSGSVIYNIPSRHSNPLLHYWKWIKLLYKISNKYQGIVLNMCSRSYVFPLVAAKLFSIPIRVMHSHSSQLEKKPDFLRSVAAFINKFLLKWSATNYFACSRLSGEWMFGKKSHFKIIPNSVDITKFNYNPTVREKMRNLLNLDGKFVIGHVGRFSYVKNHTFLIDVFYEYHKLNQNSVLILVGGGGKEASVYKKKINEKIRKYQIENFVYVLGQRTDVADLMQAMDCFILPSHFEGLPVVGIEAQTAGLLCWFSDAITREIEVTELAHFLSLNLSPVNWAQHIYSATYGDREGKATEIRKHGFDIIKTVHWLECFYSMQL